MNGGPDPIPEQLLGQARAGDADALGQLLELYRNYLATLARLQIGQRLQGKVGASDVVQDAFLEAQRDFPQFKGQTEAELVGWLRQILASNLVDLIRRYRGTQRRDFRLEREVAFELDQSSRLLDGGFVSPGSSPSDEANRREQGALLADALEKLPLHYREVIFLCHFQGLSFPDVARRMGRSLDSVKHLWARALARLRRSMRELP
jgi:RNA polymerase sigma-70 factor (ECF subfamily)